jgi:hypothetical protein
MLLRHLLQPLLVSPVPIRVSENLVTYRTVAVEEARAAAIDCPACQKNPHFGFGDCGEALGFTEAQVRAMTEPPKGE